MSVRGRRAIRGLLRRLGIRCRLFFRWPGALLEVLSGVGSQAENGRSWSRDVRQRDLKNGLDMQYVVNIKRIYAAPRLHHSMVIEDE